MRPLATAPRSDLATVRFVLTDMDETLTHRGRLAARTYEALERLQAAGVVVLPVTAAPAGWGDQMARMWPVDGVIAENGGLFLERDKHGALRTFWSQHAAAERQQLDEIASRVKRRASFATLADDQPFRLTTLAFQDPREGRRSELLAAMRAEGLQTTMNNLWVLGWLGGFDKLAMARRILSARFALDVDADNEAILYVGDSINDAPMFDFCENSVGVSTVVNYLPQLSKPPAWVTKGPGGAGFVEVADAVIAARRGL